MLKLTASALFLSSTLLVPALAQATTTTSGATTTHTVQVGASGLAYTPDSVTAAQGDIIEYHFNGNKEHDVVQGDFASPCSDNNGVYSGYQPTSDVFQVTVTSTDPMWMYCSTPGHCQAGMAMVVNQAGSDTLAAYQSAASGTSNSNAPANVQGGNVVAVSALGQSSGSASNAASSSSSSASSAASAASSASSSSASQSATSAASAASASSTAASGAAETISQTFQQLALAVGLPVLALLF